LHIKNYESNGYWDFWEKQDKIPGQDCDTICGLLDSIKGKLDGKDDVIGKYSGQIIAHIYENNVNIAVKRILVWQSIAGFCGFFMGFIGIQIVMALHNV
jgi:hypothetical protein